MKRQFFSGNSLEQALVRAASQFGIAPDRVAYTVRDKKHGFLKVRRRVVIEVDPASPELPEDAPSLDLAGPETKSSAPPLREEKPARGERAPARGERAPARGESRHARARPAAPETPVRVARGSSLPETSEQRMPLSETASVERAVREVLRFLRVEADVAVERGPDVFEVEISRADRDALVDREGRLLQAMDYLVPRLVRNWAGRGVPVKIDYEGFRSTRERELQELAARTAEQVLREGSAQSLEPMHPADRRTVHLALAETPGVETESEGEGFYKRVRISATEDDPEEREPADGVSRETWAVPFPR